LAKTAPFMEFFALFSELSDWINGAMPVLATVVRYQRWFYRRDYHLFFPSFSALQIK